MVASPKSICPEQGCMRLTDGGRCPEHTRRTGTTKNRSGDPFYSSKAWKMLRRYKLIQDPWCQCDGCTVSGQLVPADRVDHIKPRREHPELSLVYDNLRSMSEAHHNAHTARQTIGKIRGAR